MRKSIPKNGINALMVRLTAGFMPTIGTSTELPLNGTRLFMAITNM